MALYFVQKFKQKHPPVKSEELIALNSLQTKPEMVEKLTSLLELPVSEYKEREAVSAEILEVLKKYYPNCLLAMFGSSINGFGVKNCDLDLLFLPYPDYKSADQTKSGEKVSPPDSKKAPPSDLQKFPPPDSKKAPPSDLQKVPPPDPEKILSGETPRDVLHKLEDWSHFKFLKAIFKKEKSVVKRVLMIPGKNPSLKIHHINSKFICDLHISSKLVIFNSELLQFLEKVDPRIKPLVLTLCYWGRSLGFIKRSFFSNYAFIFLIVFYLQNTNPPILPPIQHLIDRAGFNRVCAGWQTAFTTDKRVVKKSKNTKSLIELLIDFFQFYWNFDFVQNIVSPNSGKILPVKAVKDSKVEKMKEFELSPLNIQDPFVLSRNICKIENETPTVKFKFALQIAQQMLQNIPEKFKFSMLFDPLEYQKVFDFHYAQYVIGRPKICFINLDYDCMSHLSKNSKFSQQLWFEKVSQAVYEVLQYGLLIECEVTDKMNYGKNIASAHEKQNGVKSKTQASNVTKSGSDISLSDLELIQSVQCVVYSRTWMGRKKFAEINITEVDVDDFNSSVLKTEHVVSRVLIKKNPLLDRRIPLMCFKCDCYKHTCSQISNVIVMLKPLTLSREFYQVATFLASYIPKTVKKMILNN